MNTNFDIVCSLNHNKNKGCFSLSEENIIKQFTMDKNDNLSHEYLMKQFYETDNKKEENKNAKNEFINYNIHHQDNEQSENSEYEGRKSNLLNHSEKHLLNKIRNLENEKRYLLQFLEDKKNQEIEYKQALETQVAIMNSENKKSEFYEKEWLKMRSLEYYLINSGKAPLRHILEKHYKDNNIYEKIGSLTNTQKMFVASVIEDHKKLIKEKNTITKKYHDAVDSNFQLYQQNEMLKAQNMCLLNNNTDEIRQELDNKLCALNASLMHVQKENIEMREIIDQYSKLITNIKKCSEISQIKNELDKFGNFVSI